MTVDEREPANRDDYRWVALTYTTAAVFMSALDGSIVIISLAAIFRGIHLDPLAPANIAYLLWMIMGYRLVQSVLVVTLGCIGDMYGRVRVYNAGFTVFTVASVRLSFDPFGGSAAARWLIGWRLLQAAGGSMLTANSAAILTDAFPRTGAGSRWAPTGSPRWRAVALASRRPRSLPPQDFPSRQWCPGRPPRRRPA